MKLKESTLEWIEHAEHDLLTVKTMLTSPRIPFEIVAYHSQQMAEKYLKAALIEHGAPVPFVHDLLKLNREVQSFIPGLSSLEEACEMLTPFGTATRYPGSSTFRSWSGLTG